MYVFYFFFLFFILFFFFVFFFFSSRRRHTRSLRDWSSDVCFSDLPSPFPAEPLFGIRYMSAHQLGAIGVTLAVLAALYVFFRFTPVGLAMRAAAQNPVSSRLVGIRVGWMLALGWGLAAAVGAVAGIMIAP